MLFRRMRTVADPPEAYFTLDAPAWRDHTSDFLVYLKMQSKHRDKNCPVRMYTKLFEVEIGKIETIFRFLDALKRDKI